MRAVPWKRDEDHDLCMQCVRKFSFFWRRHHCRRCGGVFCSVCCPKFLKPEESDDESISGTAGDKGCMVSINRIPNNNDGNSRQYRRRETPSASTLSERDRKVTTEGRRNSMADTQGSKSSFFSSLSFFRRLSPAETPNGANESKRHKPSSAKGQSSSEATLYRVTPRGQSSPNGTMSPGSPGFRSTAVSRTRRGDEKRLICTRECKRCRCRLLAAFTDDLLAFTFTFLPNADLDSCLRTCSRFAMCGVRAPFEMLRDLSVKYTWTDDKEHILMFSLTSKRLMLRVRERGATRPPSEGAPHSSSPLLPSMCLVVLSKLSFLSQRKWRAFMQEILIRRRAEHCAFPLLYDVVQTRSLVALVTEHLDEQCRYIPLAIFVGEVARSVAENITSSSRGSSHCKSRATSPTRGKEKECVATLRLHLMRLFSEGGGNANEALNVVVEMLFSVIRNILNAVAFLHDEVAIAHRNISMDEILVDIVSVVDVIRTKALAPSSPPKAPRAASSSGAASAGSGRRPPALPGSSDGALTARCDVTVRFRSLEHAMVLGDGAIGMEQSPRGVPTTATSHRLQRDAGKAKKSKSKEMSALPPKAPPRGGCTATKTVLQRTGDRESEGIDSDEDSSSSDDSSPPPSPVCANCDSLPVAATQCRSHTGPPVPKRVLKKPPPLPIPVDVALVKKSMTYKRAAVHRTTLASAEIAHRSASFSKRDHAPIPVRTASGTLISSAVLKTASQQMNYLDARKQHKEIVDNGIIAFVAPRVVRVWCEASSTCFTPPEVLPLVRARSIIPSLAATGKVVKARDLFAVGRVIAPILAVAADIDIAVSPAFNSCQSPKIFLDELASASPDEAQTQRAYLRGCAKADRLLEAVIRSLGGDEAKVSVPSKADEVRRHAQDAVASLIAEEAKRRNGEGGSLNEAQPEGATNKTCRAHLRHRIRAFAELLQGTQSTTPEDRGDICDIAGAAL